MKAAADGDTEESFSTLENIDAIHEAGAYEMHGTLVRAYIGFVKQRQSPLVVSQTRAEVRALNDSIRAALLRDGEIQDSDRTVSALESIDLTGAQKLDSRFYPDNHVVVFNRRIGGCDQGTRGRVLAANQSGIIVETVGKVRAGQTKTCGLSHGLHTAADTAREK